MTHSHRLALAAAALAIAVLAAPAAQAFTFEKAPADGTAAAPLAPGVKPYLDPTDKSAPADGEHRSFSSDGMTTVRQGGVTLQFGHQRSFDEKYNPDALFDPQRFR
jgi:hypothetical protein